MFRKELGLKEDTYATSFVRARGRFVAPLVGTELSYVGDLSVVGGGGLVASALENYGMYIGEFITYVVLSSPCGI